jgi:hypothetical protein
MSAGQTKGTPVLQAFAYLGPVNDSLRFQRR